MTCRRQFGWRWLLRLNLPVAILVLAGCQSGGVRSTERLEVQLRDQQASLESLRDSLSRTRAELDAARIETAALRNELAATGSSSSAGEPSVTLATHEQFSVDHLEVVSMLSGGLDRDNVPGDELLSVLIAPRSASGETHRIAGQLSLEAIDFSRPDDEQVIGEWAFGSTETAALWHSGVVGRGFRVVVPLERLPLSGDLTVHARVTTTAGRQFDVTEVVRMDVTRSKADFAPRVPVPESPIRKANGSRSRK